jgi:hypothetical protein
VVGAFVGALVGAVVGVSVGALVGALVGVLVGDAVGALVGAFVGAAVGLLVGALVGALVGVGVGILVGALVGPLVGPAVGTATHAVCAIEPAVHAPAAHPWHIPYASLSWNLPLGQWMQFVFPVQALYLPVSHARHEPPDAVWYLPTSHSSHAAEPATANRPGSHSSQPSALYVALQRPSPQSTQRPCAVPKVRRVPGTHAGVGDGVGDAEGDGVGVAVGTATQSDAAVLPVAPTVQAPTPQAWQAKAAGASEYCADGQSSQPVRPWPGMCLPASHAEHSAALYASL